MDRLWLGSVSVVLIWCAGCKNDAGASPLAKDVTETYGINVVTIGWDVSLYMNDQPAFRGGERSGGWDLTRFIVDGENNACLEVTARDDDAWKKGSCEVNLYRVKLNNATNRVESEIVGGINERGSELARAFRKQVTFCANAPARWNWQTAPNVGQLSAADCNQIEGLIKELARAYRRRDPDAVREFGAAWALGSEPVVRVLGLTSAFSQPDFEASMRRLMLIPEFEVHVSSQETWRFATGTKLVHVSVEQPPTLGRLGTSEERRATRYLLYVGFPRDRTPAENEAAPYRVHDVGYAMRSDDGWTWLRDEWAVLGE